MYLGNAQLELESGMFYILLSEIQASSGVLSTCDVESSKRPLEPQQTKFPYIEELSNELATFGGSRPVRDSITATPPSSSSSFAGSRGAPSF